MTADAGASLSNRSFHALKWDYAGNFVRASLQLLIGVILARLLGPEAYGTAAIALLVVGAGMLIADAGFGAALVQRAEIDERDVGFVFTVQVCVGALLSAAGIVLAGAFAEFFRQPDSVPVIRAMALLFLLQSAGQTPIALLKRSLDFRAVQGIGITSYVTGYVAVGIPCALLGYGVWSLVAAQLVQSASYSLIAMRRSGISVRPVFSAGAGHLLSFGTKVIVANVTSWALLNADSMAVGRLLGVVDLGLYGRALALVVAPTSALIVGMQGVMFAACSRAQADPGRLKRAFLAAAVAGAGLCLPVFVTVASVPGAVIGGVYGEQWLDATPVLVPLALAMPVFALLAVVGPVLTATNRVTVEIRAQIVTLTVMIPVLLVGARHSLVAVAWGMLLVYVVRCALLVSSVLGVVRATWAELLRALAWPGACAAATALVTFGTDRALEGLPRFARLGADTGVAAATLLLVSAALGRKLLDGPHADFLLADGRLPAPLRRWLTAVKGTT